METKKSFTLVELMVTITIIGILTSIGVVVFGRAQMSARDGKRQADLATIQNALEMYASEHNEYPTAAGWITGGPGSTSCWIAILCAPVEYAKTLPKEETNATTPYMYMSFGGAGGNAEYKLQAYMEIPGTGKACPSGPPGGTGQWYCVESP